MVYSLVMSTPASHPAQPVKPIAPTSTTHAAPHEHEHEIPKMYTVEDAPHPTHDIKTFISWHAPGRPFKERSKEYFVNGFLIMMAVEIILFLFTQYLLMLVVFSFVFLAYSLAIVPPREFYYKITSEGIRVEDHFFIWEELYDFYFMPHHEQQTLHVRTKAFFPGELTITLGDVPVGQVKKIILPYLPYREYVKPNFTEQAGDWLQKNFPLERSQS
jgi:hypothetical protein